jgi:hypothetical protein
MDIWLLFPAMSRHKGALYVHDRHVYTERAKYTTACLLITALAVFNFSI